MSAALSQAAFARLMEVHRSQVSRWVARGMPTMAAGRIDPDVAADWVDRSIDPGVRYAARQARQRRTRVADDQETQEEAFDTSLRIAVSLTANLCPLVAAESVRELGFPEQVVQQVEATVVGHIHELVDGTCRDWIKLPEPLYGGPTGKGYRTIGAFWRKIRAAMPGYLQRRRALRLTQATAAHDSGCP